MFDWIYAGICLRNLAVGVNQERMPRRKLHHAEIGQRPVGVRDFVVSIGKEFEVQAFFGAKVLVRIHTIEADADYDRIALGILRLIDLKVVRFPRTSRSLIFRIEIENDPLATVIFQAYRLALLRRQCEVRCGASLCGDCRVRQKAGDEYHQHCYHNQKEHDP
jgi:hypothetical protein